MTAFEALVFIAIILTLFFGCANAFMEIKHIKNANSAAVTEIIIESK